MIPGVPYDAEIEYLESTGTEYINTGYKSTGIGLEAYVRCARTTTSTAEVGIVATAAQYAFDIYADRNICIWNQYTNILTSNIQMTKDTVFDITGGMTNTGLTLTVDGKSFSRTATPRIVEASDILLFSYRYTYKFIGRIYRCKLYDNNTLVRDFIPVRVGQTGYMYDRVTKRLFGNNGTGSFVLGPDVAKPAIGLWGFKSLTAKDYISNGLVAMWDGIENAGWGRHTESPELFKELVGGQPVLVGGQFGSGLTTDPNYEITENGLKSNTVGGNYAIGVGVPFTTNLGSNWTIEWCRYAHSIPNLQAAVNTIMVYPYVDHNGRIWEYVNANESTFRQKYSGEWNTKVKESSGSGSTFAITCNPTTKRICYKNGTAGGTNGNAFYYYYSANTTHIGLGTNKTGATLYAFRIYNRALSASEMSFNHKIDKERFRL